MGRRCCIIGCTSTSRLPEHHGVTYHSFPLDRAIRNVWIRNTRLNADRQITKSVLVCSRHFRRADFQPQRSGKYLLKQRVFPTVFPWGKIDPSQVEADLEQVKNSPTPLPASEAVVEEKVKQIMAETAELNAAAGIKAPTASVDSEGGDVSALSPLPVNKFEAVTIFSSGTRLEAQDFDGLWHAARVVEVDNDDREVLIKFERSNKHKSQVIGTEEWIPMNSTRLRQKVSTKPIPTFQLEDKCMARWSGPRKFPGTIKKILGNDLYEVLFDDGYIKNVRAIHMSKLVTPEAEIVNKNIQTTATSPVPTPEPVSTSNLPTLTLIPTCSTPLAIPVPLADQTPALKTPKSLSPAIGSSSTAVKKRAPPGPRRDWPLLDMSKLDLASLKLPEIPRDGEWTCHWVNDQPIGREGFLIVGEHRKPTVVVEDWRLPPGWVKHMYQRSNVLGKWDVILVTPGGKRFRSKSDLKIFLEDQGQVYNPDIYDFSIHRRRAKDINAYVFTPEYTPQQPVKPKPVDVSTELDTSADTTALATSFASGSSAQYIETPVATPVPPMELMTPTATCQSSDGVSDTGEDVKPSITPTDVGPPIEDGFAFIGGLKVQIVDNLFRCPHKECSKNFRKENHLQIHVKHYHRDLMKLLGACPKMQELAEKRTHIIAPDQNEPLPKNQIPNQQFFAKMHQQDLLQTRGHRKSLATTATANAVPDIELKIENEIKRETEDLPKLEPEEDIKDALLTSTPASAVTLGQSTPIILFSPNESRIASAPVPRKRSRFSPSKRPSGSRKSSRQRMTRRYLTAAHGAGAPFTPVITADSSFGSVDFEETRHSFNATPDSKVLEAKKRKSALSLAPATPQSSLDSPVTADSGSSLFPPLQAPSSNEADNTPNATGTVDQYIKEDGELIRIVSMRQEEIINCLCTYGEEDGLMIQCELCLCWQHGGCNGIEKESEVPDNYVCYICRNPAKRRDSMRFRHDQEWLFEGKLPTANYHNANPHSAKSAELLKKTHSLAGYLREMNEFMFTLGYKIVVANNRCHHKLYLWAKKWDDDQLPLQLGQFSSKVKQEPAEHAEEDIKANMDIKPVDVKETDLDAISTDSSPAKKLKTEPSISSIPSIPEPEAPIDPVECQQRLIEHIKAQQDYVMKCLMEVEADMDEIEKQDDLPDMKDADFISTQQVLASYIKDVDIMRQIAKQNALEHELRALKNSNKIKS